MRVVEKITDLSYVDNSIHLEGIDRDITTGGAYCVVTASTNNIVVYGVSATGNSTYRLFPSFIDEPWLTYEEITREQYNTYKDGLNGFRFDQIQSYTLSPTVATDEVTITSSVPTLVFKNWENNLDERFSIKLDVIADELYQFDSENGVNLNNIGLFPMSAEIWSRSRIYHDIYVDGTNKPVIYIHTHHNLQASVTTYKYFGTCTQAFVPFLRKELEYTFLGASQFDYPMLQDFTFEQIFNDGVIAQNVSLIEKWTQDGIAIRFEDRVVNASGMENLHTDYACILVNATTGFHYVTPSEKDERVIIRFFTGKPSQEIMSTSDTGNDGDNRNYDGSDKGTRGEDDYTDPTDFIEGSDEGSANIFHDVYELSSVQIRSLHNKLWTQEYFNVLKVNENPIDNIVSCLRLPFTIGGTSEEITIGNIATGVNGDKLNKGVHKIEFPPITIREYFHNFLDYYATNISIMLPFIGVKQLPTAQIMGKELKVRYIVDLVTGVCRAQLSINNYIFAEYDGQMGVACTLSASTQKQSEIANAMRFVNVGTGAIVGGITKGVSGAIGGGVLGSMGLSSNGVENHFQSTQTNAPISNSACISVYLIYDMPNPVTPSVYPNNYKKTVGIPCGLTYKIAQCTGYTKCGNDISGEFPRATREEVEEILSIMQNGFEV